GHVVLVLHAGRRLAAAAAALGVVVGQRLTLGITTVGDGNHAVFLGDQVADAQIQARRKVFGAALVAVVGLDRLQLLNDHFHQALLAVEAAQQLAAPFEDFLIFGQQLLVLQTGQAVQAQVQNGLGLFR